MQPAASLAWLRAPIIHHLHIHCQAHIINIYVYSLSHLVYCCCGGGPPWPLCVCPCASDSVADWTLTWCPQCGGWGWRPARPGGSPPPASPGWCGTSEPAAFPSAHSSTFCANKIITNHRKTGENFFFRKICMFKKIEFLSEITLKSQSFLVHKIFNSLCKISAPVVITDCLYCHNIISMFLAIDYSKVSEREKIFPTLVHLFTDCVSLHQQWSLSVHWLGQKSEEN